MACLNSLLSAPRSIAIAACLCATSAWPQTATPASAPTPSPLQAPTPSTQLAPVTVSAKSPPVASVAGWGDMPLSKVPLQASVYSLEEMKDAGVQRLADLTRIDPGVSDAYNSEGYIDYLTVRGFVLDNRYNFRRDGLPINAETSIPLDNKARIEVLKGTSGIQAGTSAPGGLVDYIVKRPTDAPLRSATLEWRQAGSVLGAVDLSQRFGVHDAFGLRINAAAEHIDPLLRSDRGNRNLLAVAGDWRLGSDTLLEAEVETSHRSQPSQPAFSMLGNTVPAPGDPRINLNNQPWSLPVVFDATTASLRWQQRLNADWHLSVHAATQRLRTDDRVAFSFGCTDTDGTYYADRYCPNGNYDLYDFRSENERRRQNALDVALHGRFATGPLRHEATAGVLRSTVTNRFQQYTDSFVGTGNVNGNVMTAPVAPDFVLANTDRDERSTELYLRDALHVNERLTAWLGLRHTRIARLSIGTDGSGATDYRQSFNTPWLAASYAIAPAQTVYASWGRGIESEVAPNLPNYTNHGQALPALQSRQTEIGWKGASEHASWSVAWFDIVRPLFDDACNADNSICTHQVDGTAHHRGIEANGALQRGAWTLRAGTQWLHARREGGQNAALNGLEPTNVPAYTLKLQADYRVAALAGLDLQGGLVHESARMVLPDNSAQIPGYTRVDLGAKYETKRAGNTWTLRAGIDNLFNKRAWKESPYQYAHAYLFPLAPRTVRLSLQVDL